MINNSNAMKDSCITASLNNQKQTESKDVDQVINALIKENEILSKASKDNTYTPAKALNELLKVLYIQRNQLNSLEEENDDLEQSINQLDNTIRGLEAKTPTRIMLKTQSLTQHTPPNRYENDSQPIRYQYNPNGCLSFTDLKAKLRPNYTQIESNSTNYENNNTKTVLTSSHNSLQRKTLKPIKQSKFFYN